MTHQVVVCRHRHVGNIAGVVISWIVVAQLAKDTIPAITPFQTDRQHSMHAVEVSANTASICIQCMHLKCLLTQQAYAFNACI
jgi:hypothetical protein